MGHAGEGAAIRHLEQQGYRILAHDWRNRLGQIDIVAEDGDALVLVEVKARRGTTFGLPQEAVDVRKQRPGGSLRLESTHATAWQEILGVNAHEQSRRLA